MKNFIYCLVAIVMATLFASCDRRNDIANPYNNPYGLPYAAPGANEGYMLARPSSNMDLPIDVNGDLRYTYNSTDVISYCDALKGPEIQTAFNQVKVNTDPILVGYAYAPITVIDHVADQWGNIVDQPRTILYKIVSVRNVR